MFQMREKQWMAVSQEGKDLVSRMLEVDAEHRITVEEALAHPWIRVWIIFTKTLKIFSRNFFPYFSYFCSKHRL